MLPGGQEYTMNDYSEIDEP